MWHVTHDKLWVSFQSSIKSKETNFLLFPNLPKCWMMGLERATGAYLGGFYEIFQNDLILLWALLMNGNPIWPQYLGTQSQYWDRLTILPSSILSKPLPPRRRTYGGSGSSGESKAWQDCLLSHSEQNSPTPVFPRPLWGAGWLGASGGKLEGKGDIDLLHFHTR